MDRLLLHTCCGPCLSGADMALAKDELDVTAFFFNPNIQPDEEHAKRLDSFRKYSAHNNIKTVEHENTEAQKLEPGDCENCYKVRLSEAAKYAKENGFDSFSTTLLISPYQKHDLIKNIGECFGAKFSVPFKYVDMRPFYRDSVNRSKELSLYRQKYCGCLKSLDSALKGALR
jgi:epoxyqueuosine reductase